MCHGRSIPYPGKLHTRLPCNVTPRSARGVRRGQESERGGGGAGMWWKIREYFRRLPENRIWSISGFSESPEKVEARHKYWRIGGPRSPLAALNRQVSGKELSSEPNPSRGKTHPSSYPDVPQDAGGGATGGGARGPA